MERVNGANGSSVQELRKKRISFYPNTQDNQTKSRDLSQPPQKRAKHSQSAGRPHMLHEFRGKLVLQHFIYPLVTKQLLPKQEAIHSGFDGLVNIVDSGRRTITKDLVTYHLLDVPESRVDCNKIVIAVQGMLGKAKCELIAQKELLITDEGLERVYQQGKKQIIDLSHYVKKNQNSMPSEDTAALRMAVKQAIAELQFIKDARKEVNDIKNRDSNELQNIDVPVYRVHARFEQKISLIERAEEIIKQLKQSQEPVLLTKLLYCGEDSNRSDRIKAQGRKEENHLRQVKELVDILEKITGLFSLELMSLFMQQQTQSFSHSVPTSAPTSAAQSSTLSLSPPNPIFTEIFC